MIDVIDAGINEAEDLRWREWKARGRADDARFRRRLRTVVVDGTAVIALCGALWYALQL